MPHPPSHTHTHTHIFWNRTSPEIFSWKVVFVSFPKASKTFWSRHSEKLVGGLEKFQIYGVKITGTYICEPKNWTFPFLLIPLTLPQAEGNYPFHPNSIFWRSIFSPAEKEEDYRAEKMIKIKLARVLVASFDKFHLLCNLYIFVICFVVS